MKPTFFLACLFFLAGFTFGQNRQDGYHTADEPDPRWARVQLLYIANINGNLENCGCGDPPLGGMDNLVPLIEKYRKKALKTIVVAGGDILNSYPDSLLNDTMLKGIAFIKPDLYAPGEQELMDGSRFFKNRIDHKRITLLGTNYYLKNCTGCMDDSYKLSRPAINILAWFSKDVYHGKKPPHGFLYRNARFKDKYGRMDKNDFNILLFHGALQSYFKFVMGFDDFDLVLFSHDQRLKVQANKNARYVFPGSDGEYMIRVVLYGKTSKLKPWIQKIPVNIVPHPSREMIRLIKEYHKKSP